MKEIDVADLDCIYLSYDEPNREEFWAKIKNMVPWAKRVDGVKGSDAAHKAAARASDTDRFVLIDGDNIPNGTFFNQTLVLPTPEHEKAVFRWRARNHINGLCMAMVVYLRGQENLLKTCRLMSTRTEPWKRKWSFALIPFIGPCTIVFQPPIPTAQPFMHGVRVSVRVLRCVYNAAAAPALTSSKDRYLEIWTT